MIEFLDVNGEKKILDENGHYNIAFNADCMEFLRNCPDNAFSLCVCDPPYGGGFTEGGGCKGWFTKYHQSTDCSQFRNVERERTRARHGQGKNVRQPDGTWGYAKGRFLTIGSEIPAHDSSVTSGGGAT